MLAAAAAAEVGGEGVEAGVDVGLVAGAAEVGVEIGDLHITESRVVVQVTAEVGVETGGQHATGSVVAVIVEAEVAVGTGTGGQVAGVRSRHHQAGAVHKTSCAATAGRAHRPPADQVMTLTMWLVLQLAK